MYETEIKKLNELKVSEKFVYFTGKTYEFADSDLYGLRVCTQMLSKEYKIILVSKLIERETAGEKLGIYEYTAVGRIPYPTSYEIAIAKEKGMSVAKVKPRKVRMKIQ